MDIVITVRGTRIRWSKKASNEDGVRKRGRKPGPPEFKVRFAPALTSGTSWEGGIGREGVASIRWKNVTF